MTIHDHHNGSGAGHQGIDATGVQTFQDIPDFVKQLDLPKQKKAELLSTAKRVDELVGHGCLDLAADPKSVMAALDKFSPPMAGMTAGSFANLKSRMRSIFKLIQPKLRSARSSDPPTAKWRTLCEDLDRRARTAVSRFMRFCSAHSFEPEDITDAHIQRFLAYLDEEVLLSNPMGVVRQVIKAWNAIAAARGDLQVLMPLPATRTSYWVRTEDMLPGLNEEVEKFLNHLTQPVLLGGASGRRPRPATIEQYRVGIRILVSALVADGVDIASLDRLCVVVSPVNLNRALMFLYRRNGDLVSAQMETLVARARIIARWCKLEKKQLDEIDKIMRGVRDARPRSRKYAKKHQSLIALLDDRTFRDRLYLLSGRLMEEAYRHDHQLNKATYARAAVAVEILLATGLRRKNLVALELGKTLRKIGSGAASRWIIEFTEDQVKNDQPLWYELDKASTKLLEDYLVNWRKLLCETPTPWLFPNGGGGPIDPRVMAHDICVKTKRWLGIRITPHQFRHISAELYLKNGGRLEVISQHLGHRDLNTTRNFYLRPGQREASRKYQEQLIRDRAESARRVNHKRKLVIHKRPQDRDYL